MDPLNKIKLRILELSFKHRLSHIGSCLTSLPILYEIFSAKKPEDKFVLSCGHAGLALYCVLEHFSNLTIPDLHFNPGKIDAEELLVVDGIHPVCRPGNGIDASTGSLGLGLGMALGMAMGSPEKQVYCLCSDGESTEGIIWEALVFLSRNPQPNLHTHFNFNGYSALEKVDTIKLSKQINGFEVPVKIHITESAIRDFDFLKGVDAHYHVMTEEEYNSAVEKIKAKN